MPENTSAPVQNHTRRRKIQALLAGGAVLGVGAVMTLAAWNDSEFAQGNFGSSSFNLQGAPSAAPEDGEYIDHDVEGEPAILDFSATNMSPEETAFAPLSVRLDAATTLGGTIQADGGIAIADATGANVSNLSYTIYQGAPACDAEGVAAAEVVATGTDLNANPTPGDAPLVELAAGEGEAAGAPVLLCFAVESAGEDTFVPNEDTTATWEVTASSIDS